MRRPPPLSESQMQPRRIRDALAKILDWIDGGQRTLDLPTRELADEDVTEFVTPSGVRYKVPASDIGGGGGGGGVTSFNGRTGVVVPQAGDYTAADVGLGNVTNDAQLKRAAGDFVTFTAKSVPVNADVVLIEDSAASGAKKYATLGAIRGVPPPLPYVPPTGYDAAWDLDPMLMTNPDLLANGWNIELTHSPYTALTRAGDVVAYEHHLTTNAGVAYNPTPAAGTYRSTLANGRLLIQTPKGVDVSIWRTTDALARVYGAGMGGGARDNNVRQLWVSNGAPGATNVSCLGVGDAGTPVYTASGNMAAAASANAGAPAMHFGIIVPDLTVSGNGICRWMQTLSYGLWTQSSPPHTGNLTDVGHGIGAKPLTSRIGLRLREEHTWNLEGNSFRHFEIYYIRRQTWPARWR